MRFLSCILLFICVILPSCKTENKTIKSDYYTEPHRPQFHFSPAEQWMNDPNGMVYYDGEYHLFYQYYPEDIVWGPMHWGHAVSKDLVYWEHLPIALYPDSLGYIFSGSAVIDWKNTSGLGKDGKPPMIAIFSYHNMEGEQSGRDDFQSQGIAYSNDRGRSWTKYKDNPVVPNPGIRDFRDPKVIWHEDSKRWIMVFAAYDHVKFYGSPNLIVWEHLSDFGKDEGSHGGVWECPDLFPLTDKTTGETRWILIQSMGGGNPNGGSGTQYFIGEFDGKSYKVSPDMKATYAEKAAYVPKGEVFADFEKGYGNWKAEGTAFGTRPAKGKIANQNLVSGFTGATHYAPRDSRENMMKLHLFFDVSSAELFADDGLTLITDIFFPNEDFSTMNIYANGGQLHMMDSQLYELKRAW